MNKNAVFSTQSGLHIPGISLATFEELWTQLLALGIQTAQIVEAASYSMAMVVRYALGLSASEGKVMALVRDCPAGWVALATVRHLVNADSDGAILLASDAATMSAELALQLKLLKGMGVAIEPLSGIPLAQFGELLEGCHNLIFGMFTRSVDDSHQLGDVLEVINDVRTPVHCIEAPLGVEVDSGAPLAKPLYASSTLSLGLPLQGLWAGSQFVGRHYVCDVSFTREMCQTFEAELSKLFSEQPVVQIKPVGAQTEEE